MRDELAGGETEGLIKARRKGRFSTPVWSVVKKASRDPQK